MYDITQIRLIPQLVSETWLPIQCYEGKYEVSNLGRVKSLARDVIRPDGHKRRLRERIRKPFKNHKGYWQIHLYNGSGQKNYSVHRLVASAFLGDSDLTIDHRDGNSGNNNLTNLQYLSFADNVRKAHRDRKNQVGSKNSQSKLTETQVRLIKAQLKQGLKQRIIASNFGVSRDAITKIKNGKSWQHIS